MPTVKRLPKMKKVCSQQERAENQLERRSAAGQQLSESSAGRFAEETVSRLEYPLFSLLVSFVVSLGTVVKVVP